MALAIEDTGFPGDAFYHFLGSHLMEGDDMPSKTSTEEVFVATREAFENKALSAAVLEFGEARVLLSKGRRLFGEQPAILEDPPEYPEVSTALADDADSWLK